MFYYDEENNPGILNKKNKGGGTAQIQLQSGDS